MKAQISRVSMWIPLEGSRASVKFRALWKDCLVTGDLFWRLLFIFWTLRYSVWLHRHLIRLSCTHLQAQTVLERNDKCFAQNNMHTPDKIKPQVVKQCEFIDEYKHNSRLHKQWTEMWSWAPIGDQCLILVRLERMYCFDLCALCLVQPQLFLSATL